MLPFDIEIQSENPKISNFKLGSLVIPAYGSATVRESLDIKALQESFDFSQPASLFNALMLEIFMRSRLENLPTSLCNTLCTIPAHILEKAYEWCILEIRQWETKQEESGGEKKPATGDLSSGDSNSPIPITPDLAPPILETAPST